MRKLDRPQLTTLVLLGGAVVAAVVLRNVADPLRTQIWSGLLVVAFIVAGWAVLSNRKG